VVTGSSCRLFNACTTSHNPLVVMSPGSPGHLPEKAAEARPREPLVLARGLGLVAAALALVVSIGVIVIGGLYVGLACQGCRVPDGDWLANSLVVTFVVGVVALISVGRTGFRGWWLAAVEAVAAAGMTVAIVFVAMDNGDMHLDDSRLDASFLYVAFALIAILFVAGATIATVRARSQIQGE
jgi:hypothetical protein